MSPGMELRHLRYFLAVAEELHFGRAATRLHMSQPPLSQQIQRLEKELQAPLFYRTKRRVELTNAGRALLGEARALVAQAEHAAGTAQRASRGEIGQLLVGCAVWTDFLHGAKIIQQFTRRHPEVEVELRDLTAAEQIPALEAGRIHVGILRPPVQSKVLISERLLSESLILAFPRGHRFKTHDEVPWQALADEAVVARACHEAGVALKIKYEVDQPQTVLAIVAAGLGVSLVPASLRVLKIPGVDYRRLVPQGPPLETVIAWRRDGSPSFVQAFVSVAREIARARSFVA